MQINPQQDNPSPMRALLIGFALLAPLISLALLGTSVWLAIAPLVVSHMLLLSPTLVANSQWWGPVFNRFETPAREVWLTIDDGPSTAHTTKILDLLARFDARATFFVIGENAERHPHLITEILARGHALANHTQTHPRFSFWCASAAKIRREIDRCAETLRTTPERAANYFRAPAGMKNMFVHPALARRRLALIGWTVRGLDSVKGDAGGVAERIEQRVRPGAIILLHEGLRVENDPEFSIRCLELTLQRLTAHDYKFVIPRPEQLRM
ncbi:MAG: polysaccharide deacetylase family protein [Chthoniobacterales bacterium]|nr:polysaccharide deacetylase family protein [Chthoniobacterales bacterium]